jgi:HSP20 family molecular chaperone IbpA
MAFFPRAAYNTDASSFTPLFRLLDDFDKYSNTTSDHTPSSNNHNQSQRSALSHWQPRFDVRETETAYELHGELPGMSKDHLTIEFPEPQTLTIRGRTERNYTTNAAAPAAGLLENSIEATESRRNSHQATVEDDNEEATKKDGEWQAVEKHDTQRTQPARPVDKAKYWLTERNIGEFSRTFNFPTRVDQEEVTAGLKDGILSVVVPKAKKHEPRRIIIN